MIEFKRDGTKVKIWTDCGVSDRSVFVTEIECGSEIYAILLRQKFADRLASRLEQIRHEAYTQGWKDAKAKDAKKEWFPGNL